VQPDELAEGVGGSRFNPHSSFHPSATKVRKSGVQIAASFNPHSSFHPSATRKASPRPCRCPVSILTRAFTRVQPAHARAGWLNRRRFNPHSSFHPSATKRWKPSWQACLPFQSSLELSPECNAVPHSSYMQTRRGFNPHSSFHPSATQWLLWEKHGLVVSILTRAFTRVQHYPTSGNRGKSNKFQSSLELSPECNPGNPCRD